MRTALVCGGTFETCPTASGSDFHRSLSVFAELAFARFANAVAASGTAPEAAQLDTEAAATGADRRACGRLEGSRQGLRRRRGNRRIHVGRASGKHCWEMPACQSIRTYTLLTRGGEVNPFSCASDEVPPASLLRGVACGGTFEPCSRGGDSCPYHGGARR
jgi:hypothetical protein